MKDLRTVSSMGNRGQMGGSIDAVVGVVAIAVVIIVGLLVHSKFAGSIDTSGLSAAENTTFQNVRTNTAGALDLASILPYIFIGVVAIGAVAFLAR